MYGPNQRSGGALRQFWRWLILRDAETAPLQASMRRAVEHRALLTIAVGDLGVSNTTTMAVAALERGWTLYAHTPSLGTPIGTSSDEGLVTTIWGSLGVLHRHQIAHGDLRFREMTVAAGKVLFGGFGSSEYGATDEQLQSDIAQLLVTTTDRFGAERPSGPPSTPWAARPCSTRHDGSRGRRYRPEFVSRSAIPRRSLPPRAMR